MLQVGERGINQPTKYCLALQKDGQLFTPSYTLVLTRYCVYFGQNG
jgi:hypothetical protein